MAVLAERRISLTENAVEERGYDTNTEIARSFRVCMKFCLFVCKICYLWYFIYV